MALNASLPDLFDRDTGVHFLRAMSAGGVETRLFPERVPHSGGDRVPDRQAGTWNTSRR